MIPVVCALPDHPAALVRAARPELPPMALQQGIYGVVRVRVELEPSGSVRDAVVVSTPSRVLQAESIRAARESTFAAARRSCVNVASAYEFRVLYAADGPRVPPLPAPSPSPSRPTQPTPDLRRPWRIVWETGGSYSSMDRTVTSARSYTQVYDTFPLSHRAECRGTLSVAALDRVTVALQAARPQTWTGLYRLVVDPPPAPSPLAAPTPRPAVDVVAVVRENNVMSVIMDAPTAGLTLIAGSITYRVGYEYGVSPGVRETLPAEIVELTRALEAATPARCARPD